MKMTMQSDGSDETSISHFDHAQPPKKHPERVQQDLAEVEDVREKIRQFFEMRKCGFENETSVVFNNVSVEGSGTGVSIQKALETN